MKGNFFNIIKNIYTNDEACVKIGSQIMDCFEVNQGLR